MLYTTKNEKNALFSGVFLWWTWACEIRTEDTKYY